MNTNNPKLGSYENSNTGKGRPKGALNYVTREARAFALECTRSPEYRARFKADFIAGRLNPQLEQMVWFYAFGRPPATIAVKTNDAASRLVDLTPEQLAERAEMVAVMIREKARLDAIQTRIAELKGETAADTTLTTATVAPSTTTIQ